MRVLLTDMLHPHANVEKSVLESHGIKLDTTFSRNEDELIINAREADGLLVSSANINKRVIENLEKTKVIVKYGIGVDNIDIKTAEEKGIVVANVPNFCIEEVALHALSLMLMATRCIHTSSSFVKNGIWQRDPSIWQIHRFSEKSIGLMGFGKIARKLGRYLEPLIEGPVFFYDPYIPQKDTPDVDKYVRIVSLEEFFTRCSIISIHLPLTKETYHLINKNILNFARGVILINTSRAQVIEKKALVEALKKGNVSFFGSDVFWSEPPDFQNMNDRLFIEDLKTVITPHYAWYSEESEIDVRRKAAEEVLRVLLGKEPLNRIKSKKE